MPPKCTTCNNSEIIAEDEIVDSDGLTKIYYFSCGHKFVDCAIPNLIGKGEVNVTKIAVKSGEKVQQQKKDGKVKTEYVFEARDMLDKNDKDNPGRKARQSFYRQRGSANTIEFHVVRYEDNGELKHVECKTCGADWKYKSGIPLEQMFILEEGEKTNIVCLRCQAKLTRP